MCFCLINEDTKACHNVFNASSENATFSHLTNALPYHKNDLKSADIQNNCYKVSQATVCYKSIDSLQSQRFSVLFSKNKMDIFQSLFNGLILILMFLATSG